MLYLGTEIGLFITVDGGRHWVELKNNMPTMPFNDLTIHPRDNDLMLATHARGIWILDSLTALQGLAPRPTTDAQLFPIEPAEQIRYTNLKAHAGDMIFRGENPPNGAIIDYWLGSTSAAPALTVHDGAGTLVQTLTANARERREPCRLEPAPRRAARASGGFDDDDDAPRGAGLPRPVRAAWRLHRAAGGGREDARAEGHGEGRPAHRRDAGRPEDVERLPDAGGRGRSGSSRRWPRSCRRRRSIDADVKRQARELRHAPVGALQRNRPLGGAADSRPAERVHVLQGDGDEALRRGRRTLTSEPDEPHLSDERKLPEGLGGAVHLQRHAVAAGVVPAGREVRE